MKWIHLPPSQPSILVACICASWCSSCQGLREEFARIEEHLPSPLLIWLDIDDDEALLPEGLEISHFPTLLVAETNGCVIFYGPAKPRLSTLVSLAMSSAFPDALQPGGDCEMAQLLAEQLFIKTQELHPPSSLTTT
jgi:thiol-disulfide isomerase/thioredoxin